MSKLAIMPPTPRRRGAHAVVRLTLRCAAIIGSLGATAIADDSVTGPMLEGGAKTTSNQSVSLETPAILPAPAEEVEPKPVRRGRQAPDRGESTVTTTRPPRGIAWYQSPIAALGIVLAVIAAAYALLRRCIPTLRHTEHSALRIVARAGLSPKHSVALVQVGRQFVLVGISGEQVSLLCDITDPSAVAELTAHVGTAGRSAGFEQLLGDESAEHGHSRRRPQPWSARVVGAAVSNRSAEDSRSGLSDLQHKLRRLRSA